mgnify:CR=1 FL=1
MSYWRIADETPSIEKHSDYTICHAADSPGVMRYAVSFSKRPEDSALEL